MIIGNHFIPNVPPDSELKKLTGLYSEISSNAPALMLSIDSLSQSKAVFLQAVGVFLNNPMVINFSDDKTFITQGLGKWTQETVYFTNDTLNYSGHRYIKSSTSLAKARLVAPLAVPKTTTPTLKNAEQVIKDLKNSVEKAKFF
jgi:hypothetical protein